MILIFALRTLVVNDWSLIIENKEVVQETHSISIIDKYLALIHSTIQNMKKLHPLSIPQSWTSDVQLWGYGGRM